MLQNLEIHSHLPLTWLVRRDIDIVYEAILGQEEYAVALAKNGNLRAVAIAPDPHVACREAEKIFGTFYDSNSSWPRPGQNVVAGVNFPVERATTLAGIGVDILCSSVRSVSSRTQVDSRDRSVWAIEGPEQGVIDRWLGPHRQVGDMTLWRKNALRAIIFPRYDSQAIKYGRHKASAAS